MADKKDSKKRTSKSDPHDPDNLGPPVGAAASTTAQRSKAAAAVAVPSDAFVDRVLPHLKQIIAGAVALAVVLCAFFGYRWWKERTSASMTIALADVLDIVHRRVEPAPAEGAPDASKKSARPTFASYKARAEAVSDAYQRAGSPAAARLQGAHFELEAGRLDRAEALYRQAASGSSLDAVLAREGLGYVAEARAAAAKDPAERQKLLEAALVAFRAEQTDDKGPRRDYALYHEARILMLLDQRAQAKTALKKALEVVPDSAIELDIQQRLAELEATGTP